MKLFRRGAARLVLMFLLAAPLAGPAAALTLPDWMKFAGEASVTDPPRPVVTEIVEDRGDKARSVPGVVASRTQVSMGFQTLGRMVARHVDLADRVEKGELLAELAIDDLAAATRSASAALDAAEVDLATAQRTLERTTALVGRNVASTARLEEAQRAQAAAEAAVEQARSELVQAQARQSYARMTAPFAGVVSAVYESPGAVVGAGQAILQLSAEDQREALIDLPESAIVGLKAGAAFTVWRQNDDTHEVTAVLDRIDPMADSATRTRRLHLSLPADAPFRLGALVRARLGTPRQPALTLPETAVFLRDGAPHVWRVLRQTDSAEVELVPIETGLELRGRVLVRSGLEPGDEVVIRGVGSLEPGQAVGRRVDP